MIRKAATTPKAPISHHGWPGGARVRSVVTASALALRPSMISAIITGRPTSRVASTYTTRKLAPPLAPVTYGNFQILPRPTAEPSVAANTPKLLVKASLLAPAVVTAADLVSLFMFWSSVKTNKQTRHGLCP